MLSATTLTASSIFTKGFFLSAAISLTAFAGTFNFASNGGFSEGMQGVKMHLFSDGGAADDSSSAQLSSGEYQGIYNILSFGIACMGSSTVFSFFQVFFVHPRYRTAMITSGLVTLIAFYHYMRIFGSFTEAYVLLDDDVTTTGVPFNDAYRYVDWLLTVPLLLCELILVMNLSEEETRSRCLKLGTAAALMIILGYPGEISDDTTRRWVFWFLAMLPFIYIVYSLYFGLSQSFETQPPAAIGLVKNARALTVISWCTYPIVFILPMLGLNGAGAITGVQVGYTIADVIAKPLLGFMCWMIATKKSATMGGGDLSSNLVN